MTGDTSVRCRVRDVVRRGRALSIEQAVDPDTVVAAVRAPTASPSSAVAVECPAPTPLHDHVGWLAPGVGLRQRTALARAGRTRGMETPYDDERAATREQLQALTIEDGSVATLRKQLAEKTSEIERLREQVATARGRVQAARQRGEEVTDSAETLESAIRELSEVETTRSALEQRLERAREDARQRRDRLEQRRQLEERLANLDRQARQHLVDRLQTAYQRTLSTVPGVSGPPPEDPFDADPLRAGLAIARLGSLRAPVVVACDRFGSATAAADWLDAAVVYV